MLSEQVGMESEGFAIYDSLMQLKNEVMFIFKLIVKCKHISNRLEQFILSPKCFCVSWLVLTCAGTYSLCGSSHRSRMFVTFSGHKG